MPGSRTGWLALALTIRPDAPFSRRDLQIWFEQADIQTRVVFTGNILRQPAMAKVEARVDPAGYPQADAVTRGGILLACHHGLSEEQIDHIHATFRGFVERHASLAARVA
jgi:CDP-6-deoxy-D-xylo-4-hexulose-3-dehydrase